MGDIENGENKKSSSSERCISTKQSIIFTLEIINGLVVAAPLMGFAYEESVSTTPIHSMNPGQRTLFTLNISFVGLYNITATIFFIRFAIKQFHDLFTGKFSRYKRAVFLFAATPAIFSAGVGEAFTMNGLGKPLGAKVAYVALPSVVSITVASRLFSTFTISNDIINVISHVFYACMNSNIYELEKFKTYFKRYGEASDLAYTDEDKQEIDLFRTREKMYTRLSKNQNTPYQSWIFTKEMSVLILRLVCVAVAVELFPLWVENVDKGLPYKGGHTPSALIGGGTHELFYIYMAWIFIPVMMTLTPYLLDRKINPISIGLIYFTLFGSGYLSGTGLKYVADHEKFGAVVNTTLLDENNPYRNYWEFFKPLMSIFSTIASGVFCNVTGFVLLVLTSSKFKTPSDEVNHDVDVIIAKLVKEGKSRPDNRERTLNIQETQPLLLTPPASPNKKWDVTVWAKIDRLSNKTSYTTQRLR